MNKQTIYLLAAGLAMSTQIAAAQTVKLAKIGLGMDESEVRAALAPSSPHYIPQRSASSALRYLLAESTEESFAFTFIDGKVAAFSLVHLLPPGQQPYLPVGTQPTVKVLRDLVIKQTWLPADVKGGETIWLSDSTGAPLATVAKCTLASGPAWVPYEGAQDGTLRASERGLKKPSLASYPAGCGVSIHLSESPAASEDDRVTTVEIKVLDIKAMNHFLAKRP